MRTMTDEQIEQAAKFYGISVEEGRRRMERLAAHRDDPNDPICVGCARRPDEMTGEYLVYLEEGETAKDYVLENEGTLNTTNGHFLCDECYIKNGSPSSPRGWTCP